MNLDNFFKAKSRDTKIALSISALGLLLFFGVAFTLPFNSSLNKSLFPKPPSYAAGNVALTFSPTTLTVAKNQQFDVVVNMEPGGQQVTGINLYVKFDPNFLQAISITETTYFPNVFKSGTVNNISGIASIQLGSSVTAPKTTPGTFVNIKFQAKTTITSTPSLITISTATPDNVLTPNNTWVGVKNYSDANGNSINGRGTPGQSAIIIQETAPPPTTSPTTSSSPTTTPCTITQAFWSTPTQVTEGTQVTLNIVGNNNCDGQNVAFRIRERDGILEGGLDEDANTQPAPATVIGNTASTIWQAEYNSDGLLGIFDPPEYYFIASVVSRNSTMPSTDPLLEVSKAVDDRVTPPPSASSAPLPSLTPKQIKFLLKFDDIDNKGPKRPIKITFRESTSGFESESDVTPTVDANGVFSADVSADLPDRSTDIFIKEPSHLSKKFTVNLSSGPSITQDYTATALVLGDVNNDDRINALDIGKIIEDYSGDSDTSSPTIADLNLDSKVNASDISFVINNYLKKGEK